MAGILAQCHSVKLKLTLFFGSLVPTRWFSLVSLIYFNTFGCKNDKGSKVRLFVVEPIGSESFYDVDVLRAAYVSISEHGPNNYKD